MKTGKVDVDSGLRKGMRWGRIAVLLLGGTALWGHGDGAGEAAWSLQEHMEEFVAETEGLVDQLEGIATAYEQEEKVSGRIEEWIAEWENVEVHEAIEVRVVELYPPIWQGIYRLQQATEAGKKAAAVRDEAERTKAALWQGLGGLRAAAFLPENSRAGEMEPKAKPKPAKESGQVEVANRIELTGDDNMRFNKTYFRVRAGEPVRLTLKHIGELPKEVMGHNVVVLQEGTQIKPFALAAAEAPENDYLPTDPAEAGKILAATEMLGGGESDTLTFTLEKPGMYPFLCSFTAHYQLMQGTIEAVAADGKEPVTEILEKLDLALASYEEGATAKARRVVARAYMEIFEGLEGDLIERDPELVSELEMDFNARLPILLEEDGPLQEVESRVSKMKERLRKARKHLEEAEEERSSVF